MLCLEFPRRIESIVKVLHREIGFQDLEKKLNLVKMYKKYWKSMEILNSTVCWFKFGLTAEDPLQMFFALCSKSRIFQKWI